MFIYTTETIVTAVCISIWVVFWSWVVLYHKWQDWKVERARKKSLTK